MSDSTIDSKAKSRFNILEIIKSNSKLSLISGGVLIVFGIFLLFNGWSLAAANDEFLPDKFNIYWMATFAAFLIGFINIFVKDGLTKSTYFSRIIVGSLFVVSGLIKANDPMGFSIKLSEYFEPNALDFPSLMLNGWPMVLSIIIAAFEVVLGLAVLLGGLIRVSTWALLGMILFFGWLTHFTAGCQDDMIAEMKVSSYVAQADAKFLEEGGLNSAERKLNKANEIINLYQLDASIDTRIDALDLIRNKEYVPYQDTANFYISKGQDTIRFSIIDFPERQCVLDCGCFGDALKGSIGSSLTAWESFLKDLVLFILIIPIMLTQKRTKFNNRRDDMILLSGGIAFSLLMGVILFDWWFPTIFMLVFFAGYLAIKNWVPGKDKQEWMSAGLAILFSFGFVLYTFTYLPIRDYRGYAIGNSIREQMNNGVVEESVKTFYYYNIKTKEIEKYTYQAYMNDSAALENPVDSSLFNSSRLASDGAVYVKLWDYLGNDKFYEFEEIVFDVTKPGFPNTILDFAPAKMYDQLTNKEKSAYIIDSLITLQMPNFVEKIIVMEDAKYGYMDTLTETDYDPTYYPLSDSTYKTNGWEQRVIQPLKEMKVEFTDYLLSLDECLWIVSYTLIEERYETIGKDKDGKEVSTTSDVEIAYKKQWENLQPLIKSAQSAGMPIYLITSATDEVVELFRKVTGTDIEILQNDGTELKIIVRSNPGIVYLEKGVVKNKWDYNRIPIFENLK
ncbi:MAG: putative membrane protein YphA (DoxX/SURF4 family) [Flavobacteriales bacterium]|jgi:uncharacterized membrane protein YphA (DoxX/SURF4 family)